jgi:hypothetical protein
VRKNPFSQNQQLQVFDFIDANFAILIVFEFFLTTAEYAEFGQFIIQKLLSLRPQRLRGAISDSCSTDNPKSPVMLATGLMPCGQKLMIDFDIALGKLCPRSLSVHEGTTGFANSRAKRGIAR